MKFCTGKQREDWRVESMGKLKYKYVVELHRSEKDGGDLVDASVMFGSKLDFDPIFRNHPELKSITIRPANNEEGQTNDKD